MIADLIKELSITAGAGALALGGAVNASHVSFSAWFAADTSVPYVITDGDNREIGVGTYRLATNTFERTIVEHTIEGGVHTKTGAVALVLSSSVEVAVDLTAGFMATKSDVGHEHVAADVTDLQNLLDGKLDLTGGVISGDLTVQNMTVQGDLTTVTANEVNIGDATLTLNALLTGAPTIDAGLIVNRGTLTDASILFDETADLWKVTNGLEVDGELGFTTSATIDAGVGGLISLSQNGIDKLSYNGVDTWGLNGAHIDGVSQFTASGALTSGDMTVVSAVDVDNSFTLQRGVTDVFTATGVFDGVALNASQVLRLQTGGVNRVTVDAVGDVAFGGAVTSVGLTVTGTGAQTTFDSGALASAQLDFKRNGILEGFLSWDLGAVTLSANGGVLNFSDPVNIVGGVLMGNLTLNNRNINRETNADFIQVGGGTSGSGGDVLLFGGTHATQAGDVDVRSSATSMFHLDGTTYAATFAGDILAGSAGGLLDTGSVTSAIVSGGAGISASYGLFEAQGYRIAADAGKLGAYTFHNVNSTDTINKKKVASIEGWSEGVNTEAGSLKFYTHNNTTGLIEALSIDSSQNTTFAGDVVVQNSQANLTIHSTGVSQSPKLIFKEDTGVERWSLQSNETNGDFEVLAGATTAFSIEDGTYAANFAGDVILGDNAITSVLRISGDAANTGNLNVSGGNANNQGGNFELRGGAHPTQANDVFIRGGANIAAHWDNDLNGGTWDFQGNHVADVGNFEMTGAVLNAANLPTYADDTAAALLATGDIYRTATGELRFKL